MRVGRFELIRLDNLESRRENRYRHPHSCIVVSLAWKRGEICIRELGEERMYISNLN
jgi:hypothetical protein